MFEWILTFIVVIAIVGFIAAIQFGLFLRALGGVVTFAIVLVFLVAVCAFVFAAPAHAQIQVGQAVASWSDYLNAIVQGIIGLVVGVGGVVLVKFTGIKIEDSRRAALQTALGNAAGALIQKLGTSTAGLTATTGHPALDDAVNLVLKGAPDAVAHFGLTPDRLREMILAKVPQVTAAVAPAA